MRGCWGFADRLLYWHEVVPTAGSSPNQNWGDAEVSAEQHRFQTDLESWGKYFQVGGVVHQRKFLFSSRVDE